jgi:Tol biopolymer transport system component
VKRCALFAMFAMLVAVPVSTAGRGSFRLADDPTWSPDGRRIAFSATNGSGGSPSWRLYTMRADGRDVRALTRAGFDARSPSWSPDGDWIAFTHTGELWLVRPEGSGLHRIGVGSDPSWSPRGHRIAFTCGISICDAKPDGGDRRVTAEAPPESGGCRCFNTAYSEPTWSPDGEFVAFAVSGAGGECGFDVFIGANRGYGAPTKDLLDGWLSQPDWARHGGAIAVTQSTPDGGSLDVRVFDSKRRGRTLEEGWHPRFSFDARRIVFVRGSVEVKTRIAVMNADGSHVVQLTS